MEAENQNTSKKNDEESDSKEKPIENEGNNGECSSTTKVVAKQKRNYRRRTDRDSSDEDMEEQHNMPLLNENVTENQSQPIENDAVEVGIEAVEIEDLHEASGGSENEGAAADDDDDDHDSHFDDDDDSDLSDISFGSPSSALVRFGLGRGRMFGQSDSDSDSSEDDEELRDKANRATNEIMNKEHPQHNNFSWPTILFNRQSGYFCKQTEARFSNHRKVFERAFYGSLNGVERLELMAKLTEHLGCVNCLGFSKNGLYLLSGSDDLRVILWNWYNDKPLTLASSKHKKNIFQTKFYDESDKVMRAVSASADGSISIHQFLSDGGHTEKQVYTHQGAVHKIAVTDNVIYSCGEDGQIIEFDFRTKTPVKLTTVREKHRKIPLFSITAHPQDYSKYAVSGRDQFVRVYDRRNEKTVLSRHCPQELLERNTTVRYVSCCVYNYNGTELLASFNDENIYLFDANHNSLGSYLHKYSGHVNSATIKGVNFYGPKSEFIVTGSDCSHIFFYEKNSESIVQYMRGDENGIVNVLEPHPLYPILATSGLDKDIKIWMPSNESFELKKDDLRKCVRENMKTLVESSQHATFSIDPAIIELARRFFQRQRDPSTSPNPFHYRASDTSDDSD